MSPTLTPDLDLRQVDLRPGAWVAAAQDALDELSACATLDDVAVRFGSARRLAERTLGYAAHGGSATKPAIRALGRLLHHRLGPSVAADALTWAAAAKGWLTTTQVEELLDQWSDATAAHRPLQLADLRWELDRLLTGRSSNDRRSTFSSLVDERMHPGNEQRYTWSIQHPSDWDRPDPVARELGPDAVRVHASVQADDDAARHMLAGLRRIAGPALSAAERDQTSHFLRWISDEPVDPLEGTAWHAWRAAWSDDPESADVDAGVHCVSLLDSWELRRVASDPELFDLPSAVLGVIVRGALGAVLEHPECPPDLDDALRRPHDLATLALALRPHGPRPSWRRCRGILDRLRPEQLCDLAAEVPLSLPWSLAELGLWEQLRIVLHRGPDAAAHTAARMLPADQLRASDVDAIGRHLPGRLSQVPGVAAIDRPIASTWDRASWHDDALDAAEGVRSPSREGRGAPGRFPIPVQLLDIEVLIDHGWSAYVLRDVEELHRNAEMMGNCTHKYNFTLLYGKGVMLVLRTPRGRPLNAILWRTDTGWEVGEITRPWQRDDIVQEARAVLTRAVHQALHPPAAESAPPPVRRRKPRRRPGGGIRDRRCDLQR